VAHGLHDKQLDFGVILDGITLDLGLHYSSAPPHSAWEVLLPGVCLIVIILHNQRPWWR